MTIQYILWYNDAVPRDYVLSVRAHILYVRKLYMLRSIMHIYVLCNSGFVLEEDV